MKLESERLIYVPLSLQHLSNAYVSWLNDMDIVRHMESGGDYSIDKLKCFLEEIEKKQIYFWAIHLKSNNKHIGNIKIDPIQVNHKTAEYGIMIGDKEEWNKGYGEEATKAVLNFCFTELKLRKITLGVVADNLNAISLYKKIGFESEGLYKAHVNYHGIYYDIVRMAIFNSINA